MGYGAFPLSIIEYFWRARQPYNVSVAAEVAACAALQNPTYLEVISFLIDSLTLLTILRSVRQGQGLLISLQLIIAYLS